MGLIEVKAKKGEKDAVVNYDFGDDLETSVVFAGADVVFSNYRANAKIVLQAGLRRCLETGADPVEYASKWKPGVQTAIGAVDPIVAMKARFATMSDEEKMEFIEDLKTAE